MRKSPKKRTFEQTLSTLLVAILVIFLYFEGIKEEPSAPPTSGSPATLYSNLTGDHLQKTFIAAIENAQKSIVLLIYSLQDRDVIQALKKKSEEGINVKVIYDARASVGVDRKLGKEVMAIARAATGLMHQKILVIDSEEVWLGSANLTEDSLIEQGNLVAAVRCSHLANNILNKARCMSEESYEKPCLNQRFSVGGQDCELWFLPDNKQAVSKIKAILQSAQKTIRVAMFTFSHSDFAEELIAAKKRGVNIEVFLDHQTSKGASLRVVELLKKHHIPVFTNPGQSLLHYKFLYVDENILVNGSANWTKNAFQKNDDVFMVLHSVTAEQKRKMTELIAHLKESLQLANPRS